MDDCVQFNGFTCLKSNLCGDLYFHAGATARLCQLNICCGRLRIVGKRECDSLFSTGEYRCRLLRKSDRDAFAAPHGIALTSQSDNEDSASHRERDQEGVGGNTSFANL